MTDEAVRNARKKLGTALGLWAPAGRALLMQHLPAYEAAIRDSERAKVEALIEAAERLETIWNEPLDERVPAGETDPQVIFAGRWQQYERLDEATKDVIAALDALASDSARTSASLEELMRQHMRDGVKWNHDVTRFLADQSEEATG